MPLLPPTGTTISMARAAHGFNNVAVGAQAVSIGGVGGGYNLNAAIGRGNIETSFSFVFGGKTVPFTY